MHEYVPGPHGEELAEGDPLLKLRHRKKTSMKRQPAELEKMLSNYLLARINIQNL